MAKGRRHWNYFNKCNKRVCNRTLFTFEGLLKECSSVVAIEEGRCVHQQIIQSGLESDVFVGHSLVDMYARCRSMDDAGRVFNKIPS